MLKANVIKKDGMIVLNCPYAEFYVPKQYIEKELAVDCGESFQAFGLMYLRTFSALDKPNELEILKIPNILNFFPSEKENRKMTIGGDYEDDYIVLKFYKGNNIFPSAVRCDNASPENFLNMLLGGQIPKNIPYDKMLEIFLKVFEQNKIGLPAPAIMLEMIISEVYRYAGDNSLKYGQFLAKKFDPNKKQLEYSLANVRTICKNNSSFAGISFENMDEMITSAINNKMYNRTETKTPLEYVIKF
jgi:hypothetical protein